MSVHVRLCLAAIVLCFPGLCAAAPASPLNPYNGMQERADVFEFAKKPEVTKKGDSWAITFQAKGACDATVSVVDKAGKVIRHLASGVLGKNAPSPFTQGSLSQSLEWDGKDDDGKPAPAGCTVRVSLGLDARFDKLETWALLSGIKPLAVGAEGEIYAASAGLTGAIHVFGKDGAYVRTVFPPPAAQPDDGKITAEKFGGAIAWNKTLKGDCVPRRYRFGGGFDFGIARFPDFFSNLCAGAVTADGKLCVLYSGRSSALFLIDTRDGSCAPGGVVDLGKMATDGMAASPDGKWLYFAGRQFNKWEKNRPFSHAVMRMSPEKPGTPQVFIGEPATAGSDNAHFSGPNRVACDRNGNVYVNDKGNGRIQVFKPGGSHLKTLPGVGGLFGVSHKTGAIYLWNQKSWSKSPVVTKLAGLDNPAKTAELTINGPWPGGQWREGKQSALLSSLSDPPLVWFAGSAYANIPFVVGIEDRGTSLAMAVDLMKANESPNAGGDVSSPGMWSSLHVNRRAKTVSWDPVDSEGRTYKRVQFWEKPAEGMANNKMWIVRYDPGLKKYVSFEHGDPAGAPNGFLRPYSPLLQDGTPVIGLPMYYCRGAHHHQGPFCVAPNGDIYMGATYAKQTDEELEKAGLPRLQPKRLGNICAPVLRVYGQDGTLKSPSALPGLAELEGLRVGRSGAVYVVQPWHALGQKFPDGLAAGSSYDDSRWAALIKFPGNFEKFPVGRIQGAWEATPANPTHEGAGMKVKIDGALWTYGGVSPHSAKYRSCTCMKASADLDDFERSFVCAAQTCGVNVIDSNGNVMARLGNYGNIDDLRAGKKLAFSLPRNVAASDKAMWVVDLDYRALVKTALVYRAKETVPVP